MPTARRRANLKTSSCPPSLGSHSHRCGAEAGNWSYVPSNNHCLIPNQHLPISPQPSFIPLGNATCFTVTSVQEKFPVRRRVCLAQAPSSQKNHYPIVRAKELMSSNPSTAPVVGARILSGLHSKSNTFGRQRPAEKLRFGEMHAWRRVAADGG